MTESETRSENELEDSRTVGLPAMGRFRRLWNRGNQQEWAVYVALIVLFIACSIGIQGFFNSGNLLLLVENVSVLGVLAAGMAVVVIAGGIDLSMVVTMVVSVAVCVLLLENGHSQGLALVAGVGIALAAGIFNAAFIAVFEMPALLVTLASGLVFYGVVDSLWIPNYVVALPTRGTALITGIGAGTIAGFPVSIVLFAIVLFAISFFLVRTKIGRMLYALGDNRAAAALSGLPVRRLTFVVYILSALLAFLAGIITIGQADAMDTNSVSLPLIFTVLLVVVIGGVSLTGGRGNMFGILAGCLFVGTMTNAMTLLNYTTVVQGIVTGVLILGVIVIDTRLHPRNEETARQGE